MGCHFLLQGIFPTQGSNPGLLHCRQMFYCLSHQGSPKGMPRSINGMCCVNIVSWSSKTCCETVQKAKVPIPLPSLTRVWDLGQISQQLRMSVSSSLHWTYFGHKGCVELQWKVHGGLHAVSGMKEVLIKRWPCHITEFWLRTRETFVLILAGPLTWIILSQWTSSVTYTKCVNLRNYLKVF